MGQAKRCLLILVLLDLTKICPAFANSVDPDQLAALFTIQYMNLYQQSG